MGCPAVIVRYVSGINATISSVEPLDVSILSDGSADVSISEASGVINFLPQPLPPVECSVESVDNDISARVEKTQFDVTVKFICEEENTENYLSVIEGFLLTVDDEYIEVIGE